MPRDPRTWLFDIIESASRVERFLTDQAWTDYQANELLRAGTERQFEIIGEALNHLRSHAPELAEQIRDCHKIIGFRNLLIHGYAAVDDGIVWSAATEKLPLLMEDARRLLAQIDNSA